MRWRKINPDVKKEETYRVRRDDNCVAVRPGTDRNTPVIWLSESMINWLSTKGLRMLERRDK